MRCVHEASLHEENAFITLTYDDDHLPVGGTLKKDDWQRFAKRLRKYFKGRKIKYFHCGEYGERTKRPHYHALLFGVDFSDKVAFKKSADGSTIYTSETLSRLWPAGFCTTGAVTFESAAYCARYVMKKITGKALSHAQPVTIEELRMVPPTHITAPSPELREHVAQRSARAFMLRPYETVTADGELIARLPEYTTMSLKPAIAAEWFKLWKSDVYPSDEVIMRGKPMKPPKFYDRLLELEDPAAREAIRERRTREAEKRQADSTTRRLRDREVVKLAQVKMLKRGVE